MEPKQHQWFLNALKRKNALYCRIDVWGFVSVMLALLFLLMPNRADYHDLHGISVDLSETHHAIPMPGAVREDAIRISITRDGKFFFRNHQVALDDLPDEIRDGLRNGAERKIYLVVDARAKYGDVPHILNEIRHAGVEKVSFLTWQRS